MAFVLTWTHCFAQQIRIATWNIRCVEKSDSLRGDAWSKRAPEVAKVVRFQNFEILGVQEDSPIHQTMLRELLPEYDFVIGDSTNGNAILYLAERFEVLDKGLFWYSPGMEPQKKGWDAKHLRYCNWTHFLDKRTRQDLFVFNTHWDNRGDTARIESANLTVKMIPEIAGNSPVIFMGDLNIKPDRKPLRILEKDSVFLNAAKASSVVYAPEGSFTKYRMDRQSKETLDHIFYRGILKILRFGILRETYFDGETFRFPSDHHPVMVDVEFSQRSQR